ncbi:hypothetical protein [Thalassoglobus neptunius]|nr:hypothetical protein [Thalassoglobus neptunius]
MTQPIPSKLMTERRGYWERIVVPTAAALEGFAWRVAWFALLVKLLFFC